MPFVQRLSGVVIGCFENRQPGVAEEFMAANHADVVAFLNSDPRKNLIPLATLQARIEAEGQWDTYVNFMFGNATRRNAFLKTMFIGRPISTNGGAFRTSLENAGLTAQQIARILAPV